MPFGTLGTLSELQLSLIGTGLTAVAGVWGYNKWQEYQQRKLAQRVFHAEQADVLMHDASTDSVDAPPAADESAGEGMRIEPTFAATGEIEDLPEPDDSESEAPDDLADKLVDCRVRIEAAELVAAPLFWAAQRKLFGALEGRLRWSGWNENSGQWRLLHAHDAASYRRLYGALQIADRSGPISEADLNCFMDGVRQLAEDFQVLAELPVAADVLVHARALDEFCAAVDWRIGINIVNLEDKPFAAAKLIDLATETDLWLKDDGLFHAEDAEGKTVFTLGNLGGLPFSASGLSTLALPGVTLAIDVPRVANGTQAFDRLLAVAQRMIAAFDGTLVGDNRAPLSDEILATIRIKIGEFQEKMAAQQVPAGGRRALRLYS
ncbi:MAG: cell division protein ZipA C-terminal FtsZ-binding domain-containing protein [Sterolibacterium sp.]|nr:cell division protein ZipA C-terminal FtsZ-binding domain-containing protein [Sterolibacterium sp.]